MEAALVLALRAGLEVLERPAPVGISEHTYRAALDAAARHVKNARSSNTTRAFERQWSAWVRHCAGRGIAPLPVCPGELIVYLSGLSLSGKAPGSVTAALTAISSIDTRSRITDATPHPHPVRSHALVREWVKGWRREHPVRPQRRAPAISHAQLDLLLQAAAERAHNVSAQAHIVTYARDRAMLLIGICAAMRIGELVALDVGDVRTLERGIEVFVRSSKTDQIGAGDSRGVMAQGLLTRCPVDAWLTWLRIRGDWPGPAFTPIERSGGVTRERLCDSSARRIVTRRAKAAGLDLVTSHSMRATFATLAAEKRKPITHIAQHGGWSNVNTVKDYVRQGELFVDNPTSGLLDD